MDRIRNSLAAAATLAALLSAAGCDSHPSAAGSKSSQLHTDVVSGYEFSPSYASALDFTGNDSIFAVRVDGSGQPALSAPISAASHHRYVYTPITATVVAVLKAGEAPKVQVGKTVTLRILGGETATERTINDMTAGPDSYQTGSVIQIFASKPHVDPTTRSLQYVPNWSFALSSDRTTLTNLADATATVRKAKADLMAEEKAAWARWQR